jgi:ribosomal protein L40E
MKVTPSPRVLKMLGQIEFSEWQCLAELIDNSIDALNQAIQTEGHGLTDQDLCVEVILPESDNDPSASVEVRDRGPGMDIEKLAHAVRAGWSGNDQFDQLGLFGMGFNIATARLGRITSVMTTKEAFDEWLGVEIDLDNIGDDFEAADLCEPKLTPGDHGTRVRIAALDRNRARLLSKRQTAIREKLGSIYAPILDATPIKIRVNGRLVRPRKHCVWAAERTVERGSGRNAERIHAQIEIDERLGEADACMDCGNWQTPGATECEACGSSSIKSRERRISGWVGVQRHLDRSNYGIDFVRNGRKILINDKTVFSWLDPNNPTAEPETEYPVEVPADQGRIVGEIHIDHVPVHYMKDRFDTADRSWKSAIEFLRGRGPLKPQRAKELGYPENNSPIGQLFRGFRRNDPGYSYLIPGDGKRAIHQEASSWALRFHRGDSEFQEDTKWWEGVVYHEEEKKRANAPQPNSETEVDVDELIKILGGANKPSPEEKPGTSSPGSEEPKSIFEISEALLSDCRPIPNLTKEIYSRKLSETVSLRAYEVGTPPLIDGNNNAQTPAWLLPTDGGSANIFIDTRHEIFSSYGARIIDVTIVAVAQYFLIRSNNVDYSLTQIVDELYRENFQDEREDFAVVQQEARSLLEVVSGRLVDAIAEDPNRAWGFLNGDDLAQMERSAAMRGTTINAASEIDPSFVLDAPPMYFLRLCAGWPEVFMDGTVFTSAYTTVSDKDTRELAKARLYGLMLDVVSVLNEHRPPASTNQLKRIKLAIEILASELS